MKAHQNNLLGAYCTAAEWTREEQIVLEEGLKRFPASQYNNLTRYVKIAAFLPDKVPCSPATPAGLLRGSHAARSNAKPGCPHDS